MKSKESDHSPPIDEKNYHYWCYVKASHVYEDKQLYALYLPNTAACQISVLEKES